MRVGGVFAADAVVPASPPNSESSAAAAQASLGVPTHIKDSGRFELLPAGSRDVYRHVSAPGVEITYPARWKRDSEVSPMGPWRYYFESTLEGGGPLGEVLALKRVRSRPPSPTQTALFLRHIGTESLSPAEVRVVPTSEPDRFALTVSYLGKARRSGLVAYFLSREFEWVVQVNSALQEWPAVEPTAKSMLASWRLFPPTVLEQRCLAGNRARERALCKQEVTVRSVCGCCGGTAPRFEHSSRRVPEMGQDLARALA